MRRHKLVYRSDWLTPKNDDESLNRGRLWKYNPSCKQAWKNLTKKIERERENEDLSITGV